MGGLAVRVRRCAARGRAHRPRRPTGRPAFLAGRPRGPSLSPFLPLGIGLAVLAVALESCGFVLRLTVNESRGLSMDAPYSLPRMYVAALFAAATLAAVAGPGVLRGAAPGGRV